MSRKKIQKSEELASVVKKMAQVGVPVSQIASFIGVSKTVVYSLYSEELEQGAAIANANIGQKLYDKAINGDTAALIFWAKTRMGWREVQRVDHTSSDGTMSPTQQGLLDISLLTPEQIVALRGAVDGSKKG